MMKGLEDNMKCVFVFARMRRRLHDVLFFHLLRCRNYRLCINVYAQIFCSKRTVWVASQRSVAL